MREKKIEFVCNIVLERDRYKLERLEEEKICNQIKCLVVISRRFIFMRERDCCCCCICFYFLFCFKMVKTNKYTEVI